MKDANGLRLSGVAGSGYYLVATLPFEEFAGKFIAYAYIADPDLQKAGKDFERDHGPMVPGFFYIMANVVGLGVFDDVRDAAYVAQEFTEDDLYDLLLDGDESVIATPPAGGWEYPAVDVPPREKRTRRGAKRLDAQLALAQVWGVDRAAYSATMADAPALRKAIITSDPHGNAEFLEAARMALESFRR